ncbi:MAG TPA: hypothetical protein VFN16_08605 [Saccharospirillum sp.]|nr:hypothetical protein [Saccharospirillum sp.]
MSLFRTGWLCFGLLAIVPATSAEDFGVANWGQSAMTVRDLEQRPNLTPLTERDYLIYQASLPGIDNTRLVYQFEDGRLATGRFIFSATPASPTDAWLTQFETVRALITQQYGEPVQQQVLQPSGATNTTPDDWAEALERDALILKTQWRTDQTLITQQLAWNGNTPHHQIIYHPLNGQDLSDSGASPF